MITNSLLIGDRQLGADRPLASPVELRIPEADVTDRGEALHGMGGDLSHGGTQ